MLDKSVLNEEPISSSFNFSLCSRPEKGIKLIDGNDLENFSSDELEHAIMYGGGIGEPMCHTGAHIEGSWAMDGNQKWFPNQKWRHMSQTSSDGRQNWGFGTHVETAKMREDK